MSQARSDLNIAHAGFENNLGQKEEGSLSGVVRNIWGKNESDQE